ncbi:GH92 family glycosyl hydrolase [Saccharicrinis sp. FJH62]|uniref:GH92 family glycosyl hydrolase n=1 Tax=Saccharicrinis sp. FJH62 TaxID=3344657 RepID=UPI0035D3FB22
MIKLKVRYNNILVLFIGLLTVSGCTKKQPVDYVNPFIDTHKSRWFFFSSASMPFGMVNLSPDTWTNGSWQSGYLYDSLYVRCFSHIHAWQMAGIPVMPTTGSFHGNMGMEAAKSPFSHDTEIAEPGYHKLILDRYNIKAELTSTTRVGFHRYTFPDTDSAYISFYTGAFLAHGGVDSSYVKLINPHELEGFSVMSGTVRRKKPTYVYFVAKLDHPVIEFGGWRDSSLLYIEKEIRGKSIGAFVRMKADGKPVLMKVAISYTSIENARNNMREELPGWDFDATAKAARIEWNNMLSGISVEGGSEDQRIKFYTDLWHALLGRRIVSDVNGQYCDMTGDIPQIKQIRLDENNQPVFPQYNFDALWGSQWNLNILWSMAYPEIMDGFCNSMVNMYKDGGMIPRGPSGGNYTYVMIGDPATSFFATAYNKGIRNYDVKLAYEGLRKNAFPGGIRDRAGYESGPDPTGGGMNFYIKRGYVPEGIETTGYHQDGASMTLEYAYQDWCLSQLAKSLGKDSDKVNFKKRSLNYRNLWNKKDMLIHPKTLGGDWTENFKPVGEGFNTVGFCESNAAIYTNFVPHDMAGLINLFGGDKSYRYFLESSFEKAQPNRFVASHGKHAQSWVDYENQPSCQMAHLFSYCRAPWLTQKWVRAVKSETFGDVTPYGGYNGDEDQGQMGALGVLMAIGLFQTDGGASVDSEYEITSPIFDKIEIMLNRDYYPGDKFEIITHNNATDNIYIQSARLKGKEWNNFRFPHRLFEEGGRLEIYLDRIPNKNWGIVE